MSGKDLNISLLRGKKGISFFLNIQTETTWDIHDFRVAIIVIYMRF